MKIRTAMIIDDNEGDQYLSKLMLQKFDPEMTILQAYGGDEALAMLSDTDEHPDVIFLDINMPGMNGHEFLQSYTNTRTSQATIVIMLSSSDQLIDKERSMVYDCVKMYCVKPLDLELIEEISNLDPSDKKKHFIGTSDCTL